MGTAYAQHLLGAGFEVSGWDIDSTRRDALVALGGEAATTVSEMASVSDVILSALPSTNALAGSLGGDDGLAAGAHPGLVFVEMSTFPLAAKNRARAVLEPLEVAVIDAPVSGTGLQAATAEIVIYASGDSAALERIRPVFGAIGKATFELGDFGNGSKMKYVANLLVSVHNLATAEAFVLGMKAGLEPQQILDVISAGVGSSKIFEIRGPMMVADDYPAAAKLKMFIKDMTIIGGFARDVGAPTPLLDASLPWYEEGVRQGLGDFDAAVLYRMLEDQSGLDR
jgi:3-hydroxyisobutyrate dehydrogenase-like beta-hydroxyacid dehydrogenase